VSWSVSWLSAKWETEAFSAFVVGVCYVFGHGANAEHVALSFGDGYGVARV